MGLNSTRAVLSENRDSMLVSVKRELSKTGGNPVVFSANLPIAGFIPSGKTILDCEAIGKVSAFTKSFGVQYRPCNVIINSSGIKFTSDFEDGGSTPIANVIEFSGVFTIPLI